MSAPIKRKQPREDSHTHAKKSALDDGDHRWTSARTSPARSSPARDTYHRSSPLHESHDTASSSYASTSSTTANLSLYKKKEEELGKILTQTQMKASILYDYPENVIRYNKDISDEDIREFVANILIERGKVDAMQVHTILDTKGVMLMRQAFTHWTMQNEPNYEFLETTGDALFNHIVVRYLPRRFPSLYTAHNASHKMTEALKLYTSREIAPEFTNKLKLDTVLRWCSFWYKCDQYSVAQISMNAKVKTDVFEAFIGAVEQLFDSRMMMHSGYFVAYSIVESLLNEIDMTIDLRKTVSNFVQMTELVKNLHGRFYERRIKNDRNDIIQIQMDIEFEEPHTLVTLKGERVYRRSFYSEKKPAIETIGGMVDDVSIKILKWLAEECGKKRHQ